MTALTLLDTGPLVALLDSRDRHHRWAVETFAARPDAMVTCEAVLTEACFLVARWPAAVDEVFARIKEKVLQVESMTSEADAVHGLMRRYRNVPASYADACLIRLSELHPGAGLLTVDSDFRVYRRNGRRAIPVLMPSRP